jgi:mannan endo-1,4-beta-mannosidase
MRLISTLLISLFVYVFSIAQEYPGFRVIGRHLYDKCGEKVILRGLSNPNIWFEKNGIPRYEEIKKTGANVVRIVWTTQGTASELDQAISNCIDQQMIPMVELHDATGDLSKLQVCVDYWVSFEIVNVIQNYEEYLLINIANECGDYNVSATSFRNSYTSAINEMRDAGIHVPLVIDGTDWGKNINILQSEGPGLINADPDKNLIFSIHMWWPKMYGFSESDIVNELTQSVEMELPIIVGEFSQMHGSCSDNTITSDNEIAYKTILKECQKNEIGYIAWSWFGNCNPFWDMSADGTFNNLFDWGLEVAVTDTNSILKTSERTYLFVNGICDPTQIREHKMQILTNSFKLIQNYPNPVCALTNIKYILTEPAHIKLTLFNYTGEEIYLLVSTYQSVGEYSLQLDCEKFESGIYFYRLEVNGYSETRKMIKISDLEYHN